MTGTSTLGMTRADWLAARRTGIGEVHHFCQNCIKYARLFPESVITDILEAAGVWYCTGWADENDEAARGAAERQRAAGVPAKRVIMIQKGVRT